MFKLDEFMGKKALVSSLMYDDDNMLAFFTTRDFPLKCGERKDLEQKVDDNRRYLAKWLSIPFENLFIPEQTHSDNVETINIKKKVYPDCDALITDKKDVAIVLNFADCVPIIFFDEKKRIIAIAHAGWRGTASKIAVKTIEKMKKEFSSDPKDIVAAIGPCIGKCCFEVKKDVLEKLLKTISDSEHKKVSKGAFADLKMINKLQILATGVEKIDVCEDCTCCKNELFFSYRREKGNTARHSAIVIMK